MENEFVFNGSEAVLKCKLDGGGLYWTRRTDLIGNTFQEIYDGDSILEAFKYNFKISNTSGKNDLEIHRSTFQDAGLYECISNKSSGRLITNLIIIG